MFWVKLRKEVGLVISMLDVGTRRLVCATKANGKHKKPTGLTTSLRLIWMDDGDQVELAALHRKSLLA